ncbi:hypothetical protein LEG43_22630, partial [Salmonella enterica]|nr:hypothetical protein [Salmonella enterica]MDJ8641777.1 hypothetical protein [Salmonella enterica]
MTFPPELVALMDSLEAELQRGELSAANRAWLAQCGLTPEQIQTGIHARENNPPVPLRPPGPAAGAGQRGGKN